MIEVSSRRILAVLSVQALLVSTLLERHTAASSILNGTDEISDSTLHEMTPTGGISAFPTLDVSAHPSTEKILLPSKKPSDHPTINPSEWPSSEHTIRPSKQLSYEPSWNPSSQPSVVEISSQPTPIRLEQPSRDPSDNPSDLPSVKPSRQASDIPSTDPSDNPSDLPSVKPSRQASDIPSIHPSDNPSDLPSVKPSRQASDIPSIDPSDDPSNLPSVKPSRQSSDLPSIDPSDHPSSQPSVKPSRQSSDLPSIDPSDNPSNQPSVKPSRQSSDLPSIDPSNKPSSQPSLHSSLQSSDHPSRYPRSHSLNQPSLQPSRLHSDLPSREQSFSPSKQPTEQPTEQPSQHNSYSRLTDQSSQPSKRESVISRKPSNQPSTHPTEKLSLLHSYLPSRGQSDQPSELSSRYPSNQPTNQPIVHSSQQPSDVISRNPTYLPSDQPSVRVTQQPSNQPSLYPSRQPSDVISRNPTNSPSNQPSLHLTQQPSNQPSVHSSQSPSHAISRTPTNDPPHQPSSNSSQQPSINSSEHPSPQPSDYPSTQPTAQHSSHPPQDKPNVLLILADDVGTGDLPFYWNTNTSLVDMPNLRRLASMGVTFTDAHSTPLCAPSRYMLLSGNYQHRGEQPNGSWDMKNDRNQFRSYQKSIAEVLRDEAGYSTAIFGKWHLGAKAPTFDGIYNDTHPLSGNDWTRPLMQGPKDIGFNTSMITLGGIQAPPYAFFRDDYLTTNSTDIVFWEDGKYSMPHGKSKIYRHEGEGDKNWDSTAYNMILVNETTGFIDKHLEERRGDPFFAYVALGAVHIPHSPPHHYLDGSRIKNEYQTRHMDMLLEMDKVVGSLVNAIEERQIAKDTIIIFASDNGGLKYSERFFHMSSGPLRDVKASIYEGGHRVPLIFRYDGAFPINERRSHMVGLNDVYATICDLVGIEKIPHGSAEDSVSFANYIVQETNSSGLRTELAHWSYRSNEPPSHAIRSRNLKLISYPHNATVALYDLDVDLSETNDLSGDEQYERKIKTMHRRLQNLGPCPVSNLFHDDGESSFILTSGINAGRSTTCKWFQQRPSRCNKHFEGRLQCGRTCKRIGWCKAKLPFR